MSKYIAVVAIFAIGHTLAGLPRQDSGSKFEVRDSKGRIRIATEEDGDTFGMVLFGADGARRAVLSTDGGGKSLFKLLDRSGAPAVDIQVAPESAAGLTIKGAGAPSVRLYSAKKSGVLAIEGREGEGAIKIASDLGDMSAKVALMEPGQQARAVSLWADAGKRALEFQMLLPAESGMKQKWRREAGLFVDDTENKVLWLGADAMQEGAGVRFAQSPREGAGLLVLGDGDAPPIVLHSSKEGGGLRAGRLDGQNASIGIADMRASMKIADKDTVVVRVPDK